MRSRLRSLLILLRYWYRKWGCENHYLMWRNRDGRRWGQCPECMGETEGWR